MTTKKQIKIEYVLCWE